jgi:hypothetical protein
LTVSRSITILSRNDKVVLRLGSAGTKPIFI